VTELQLDPITLRNNRIKISLIFAIPIFVMSMSYFIYYTGIGLPTGTRNKGTLIQPVKEINQLNLITQDGEKFQYSADPKWTLFIPSGAACEEKCKQNLYLTRQTSVALGKDAYRLRRFYINTAGEMPPDLGNFLTTEHPKLHILNCSLEEYQRFIGHAFDNMTPGDQPYFLVDPQGFAMMFYTDKHMGKELMVDFKFLIAKTGVH